MKTKTIILTIAALLTFGQQAMCQRTNNNSKSSTSVRSGSTGSSTSARSSSTKTSTTSKNSNTKATPSTQNSNTKAPSTSKNTTTKATPSTQNSNTKAPSTSKNSNTKAPSTSKSNNTKVPSTAKNNTTRRQTTVREPKSVNPPRAIPKGYEDRVRYDGKNWCYLRDGRWYSYDHYIEPATYYSRPLAEFGTALVVGAVVGLITALID